MTTNGDIVREVARRIEGRWAEDLSVPTLAAKAGYSLHHFSRLFAGVLGVTPKEYVLRRRVSEAARELAGGKRRVTDIAFDYGFNDLETFSRAFRRTLGATPSAVRRGAVFPYFPGVASVARASANGPSPVSGKLPVMESFPGCLLAGWSVRVGEETDAVGRLWGRFVSRAPGISRRIDPPAFMQLATEIGESEEWLDIMVGVRMETLDCLEIDLVGKAVPRCDCLVFEHRGSAARIGESYRAIYADLLPSMDRKPGLPFNFETYYPDAGNPWDDGYRFRISVPLS